MSAQFTILEYRTMSHNHLKDSIFPRGFTLIELLVVISVISLMVAILLPALAAARNQARTLKCATQLRQAHMGLLNYAYDYRGLVPKAASAGNAGNEGQWTWVSQLTVMGGYITDHTLFWCDERRRGWYAAISNVTIAHDWRWWYTGYAINFTGVSTSEGTTYFDRINIDDPRIPASELLTLGESWHTGYYAQRDGWYRALPSTAATTAPGIVPFLHDELTNASYLDGHVETHRADNIGFNPRTMLWTYATSDDRKARPWFYLMFSL